MADLIRVRGEYKGDTPASELAGSADNPRWVRLNIWPNGDGSGALSKFEGSVSDITPFTDAVSNLRRNAAELSRSNADLGSSLLDQARDQAAQGDTDAALALVDKARFQAEAALRQAEFEATAWQERVIK